MTAERIFPHYRRLYHYEKGQGYISYRLMGEGCTQGVFFLRFDSPDEAEEYFMREILGQPERVTAMSAEVAAMDEVIKAIWKIKKESLISGRQISTETAIRIARENGTISQTPSRTAVDRELKKRGLNHRNQVQESPTRQ